MSKRDEFDDEGFFDSLLNRKNNTELPRGLRRVFIVIAVLVLVSIVVAVTVSAWPKRDAGDEGAPVPIIRADTTPFKIKPQDPGGMKVPNKDSTIFETLKGEKEEAKPENLLEDESAHVEPVSRPEPTPAAPAPVVADAPVKPAEVKDIPLDKPDIVPPQPVPSKPVVAKVEEAAKVPEAKPAEIKTATKTEQSSIIETLKADNQSPEEKKAAAKKETPPAPKPAAKPVASGGSTYIQLAAVKSEAEAASQWSKFKAKNPELGALSMRTQKADLGEKGIFYRIQAGPLSASNATSTCTAIKGRGGSCIIAK